MPYAIKCVSEGEQRLAQAIMFNKGAKWRSGATTPIVSSEGQWLIYRPRMGKITQFWLTQERSVNSDYTRITMSELVRLEV